jgi:dihydroorotate dehydrogenase electron transfer subunit
MNTTTLPQPLRIAEIRQENSYNKTFSLEGTLPAVPGQFVMAWLPGHEDKPFSLAGSDPVSLTVAAVGPFSRAIHNLQVGDYIWVRGPLGQGYSLPPNPTPTDWVLLIGGGYGVAPLLFLARQALAVGFQVGMIIGARRDVDLLLVETFQRLDLPVWVTTQDGSAGLAGLATDAIAPALAHWPVKPKVVYACGPVGLLAAVAARCAAEGSPAQVGWEAHMRCGIGLCGSCEVGQGWLTCLDGPVFSFNPLLAPTDTAG